MEPFPVDVKKKNKVMFSDDEKRIIVEGVEQNFTEIQAKFSTKVTVRTKRKIWETIASVCNNANPIGNRSGEDVKKKWENMVRDVKKHLSALKHPATGGGKKDPDLSPLEERIARLYDESASFHGQSGGIESGAPGKLNESEDDEFDTGIVNNIMVIVKPKLTRKFLLPLQVVVGLAQCGRAFLLSHFAPHRHLHGVAQVHSRH